MTASWCPPGCPHSGPISFRCASQTAGDACWRRFLIRLPRNLLQFLGRPGIGKSTVIREIVRSHPPPARVARSRHSAVLSCCGCDRCVYGTAERRWPGLGLRQARVLADELHKRVVIIDTSNEIGGDGDVPHPAIGLARRMQARSCDSVVSVTKGCVALLLRQFQWSRSQGNEAMALRCGCRSRILPCKTRS